MIRVRRPTPQHRDGSPLGDPHKRLMAAVLQTVVDDCRGTVRRRAEGWPTPAGPRGLRQAMAYVASTDRAWPFSFENLCDALSLDACRLRRALKEEHDGVGSARGADVAERALPCYAADAEDPYVSAEWSGASGGIMEIVAP